MSKRIGCKTTFGEPTYNDFLNLDMFYRWQNDLRQLYSSVFTWENIPQNPSFPIDILVVERWLMDIGAVAFFYDEVLEAYLILPFNYANSLDVYGNPINIYAYGNNGYRKLLHRGEYVIIYDNLLKRTNARILETYARRLAQIDRVIDVNINAQKTPIVIEAEESQIDTVKTAYNKYHKNEPVLVAKKGSLSTPLNVFNTDAPVVFPQLQVQKKDLLDEILAFVGILNVGRYKTQHMIRSEVLAVNGLGFAERSVRKEPRDKAVTDINKMFNLNISVDYSSDHGVDLMIDENIDRLEEEGEGLGS